MYIAMRFRTEHFGRHPTNCGERDGHYEFIRQTLDELAVALNGLTAVSLHYSSFQAVERTFFTEPIKHGRKYESTTIRAYTEITGEEVASTGICVSEQISYLECSPDGLIE